MKNCANFIVKRDGNSCHFAWDDYKWHIKQTDQFLVEDKFTYLNILT